MVPVSPVTVTLYNRMTSWFSRPSTLCPHTPMQVTYIIGYLAGGLGCWAAYKGRGTWSIDKNNP